LVAFAALLVVVGSSDAQGSWLDENLVSWNAPGMAIPAAPAESRASIPYCAGFVRPPETAEDEQVADRGWLLYSPYELGWGISIIEGFLWFEVNCRPVGLQAFVFVDGVFAGTLAPQPMLPRTDGALFDMGFGANGISALYDRYTPNDGLCCPSAQTRVGFVVERTPSGPVVTPTHAEALPAPSPGR
jgi:hypothetical protein